MLEQYPISDLLAWIDDGSLVLNPKFQRRSVWPPAARTYLIDTILRSKPMPNIMIRTVIDLKTRKSVREVVDGQQRLNAIRDFADDKLVLGRRAGEYARKSYSTLDSDDKENFLGYRIGAEQLFNADEEAVLDIFRRLNSYSYSLNAQERRHAGYMGEFRSAVVAASRRWGILWDRYKIVSLSRQLRMDDDQLMAEMFGVILHGVTAGGQPRINNLYKRYDLELDPKVETKVDSVLKTIVTHLSPALNTSIARPPHFLMLFAAVAHATVGIPEGEVEKLPTRQKSALRQIDVAVDNLSILGDCLDLQPDEVSSHLAAFKTAASSSTQTIRSRDVRFSTTYKALMPKRM